ncbi:MAG: ATP synthase subunit C [Oscillospiraceae bacterium]|jgi:V/A-type H+-transporting ATPase subunit K|nr:ATP synthase subunit C [Oscillospiraceae bacterium]
MALFILPLFATALIVVPAVAAIKRKKAGNKINPRRVFLFNTLSFIGCMAVMAIAVPFGVYASETGEAAAETAGGMAEGMKYLGAALATGLATIGTGIAVGGAAPAAIGATSEDDKNFIKALIFVVMGEGVAIYGLVISILILFV